MLLDLGGTGLGELSGLVLVTLSRVASVGAGNTCRGFFLFGGVLLLLQGGESCPEQIADYSGFVLCLGKKLEQFRVSVAVDL